MGGETCTVLRLKLMHMFAMSHIGGKEREREPVNNNKSKWKRRLSPYIHSGFI